MQQASQNDELQNQVESEEGQSTVTATTEEDYKSLHSEYTRTRQSEISAYVKLATKDKKEILDITDRKIQSKVVKELYGLDNVEEVEAIYGKDFWDEKKIEDDSDEDDKYLKLEKEIKLTRFQQEKRELDSAIQAIKDKNALQFENPETEEKLRDELRYISKELPLEERIKRASQIVLGNNQSNWSSVKETTNMQVKGQSNSDKTAEDSELKKQIKEAFRR